MARIDIELTETPEDGLWSFVASRNGEKVSEGEGYTREEYAKEAAMADVTNTWHR